MQSSGCFVQSCSGGRTDSEFSIFKGSMVDLHSVCPPFLMEKRSHFSSDDMIADMTDHYFHDVSASTVF